MLNDIAHDDSPRFSGFSAVVREKPEAASRSRSMLIQAASTLAQPRSFGVIALRS
jgi:hypothetical protein